MSLHKEFDLALEQVAQKHCGISILGDIKNPDWQDPRKPGLALKLAPLWAVIGPHNISGSLLIIEL